MNNLANRNKTSTSRRPRIRVMKIAAGAALATGLVLAAPLAASAHVTVTPDSAAAGSYPALTFAFSHGCEHSPTTSLTINVPEGVTYFAPQIEPGWSIEEIGGNEAVPAQVVYTADAPVESGLRATVTLQVGFAEDATGEEFAFPVLQSCVDGSTDWSEIAADGEDPHDLESPAPTVLVTAAMVDEHSEHETDLAAIAATEPVETSVFPVVLGASGFALGAAALIVAIFALRRSRRS